MSREIEKQLPPDGSIDAGLLVLEMVRLPGVTLTLDEIAEVCGCSRQLIWKIEQEAKEKLRRALGAKIARGEI